MKLSLGKRDLLKLYEAFNNFCDVTECRVCKYKEEDECFVSYVFDKDRGVNLQRERVVKSEVCAYCNAVVEMVDDKTYIYDVYSSFFLKLKKYVITIVDKKGKDNVINKKKTKRVLLREYTEEGTLIKESVIWRKP